MEKKDFSVLKAIAIIASITASICAVIAVAMKLYSKYCLLNEPMNVLDEDDEAEDDESDAEETSNVEEV